MLVPLRPGARVALLTSGGDAPGMNAGLRAAAKIGTALGLEVLGVEDGYRGLMEGRLRALDMRTLDEACRRGGTLLGSARSREFPTPQGQARAREAIAAARLDGLLVFGGNGSLAGARSLAGTAGADGNELRVGGVPASIDNDIGCTALAIGVDTAMNTIVEACDRIADTALSHQRTFIIEVMGRDCGYLAMAAGIAAAADAVLFREGKQSDEEIVDQVMRAIEAAYARQGGRRHVLVLKSEGVRLDSQRLKQMVDERILARGVEVDTRVTVLGHVVRGGAPTALDRLLAARLAAAAMRALSDGHTQFMVGWAGPGQARSVCPYDHHVTLSPLAEVLAETERMHSGDSAAVQARVRAMKEVESVLYR